MQLPRIGVGVFVEKNDKWLLGHRIGSHGEHTWSLPGGHLEFGETPTQCAIRETHEETNLIISDLTQGPWTNDFFEQENKHYVTLFMFAGHFQGQAKVMEPNKCVAWQWFDKNDLPKPLFLPLQNFLKTQHQHDAAYA
jgi:8-oxo-dGTP diphosphatase